MGIYYGKADFINYGKPSLLLDFANKKSLTDRISGNNLITFTRTSTGTYVGSDGLIKSAAVNEARFDHDPYTGESLGLLIEEQRGNLFTQSTNSNHSSITGVSVLDNDSNIIAPNGTTTATGYTPTSPSSFNEHIINWESGAKTATINHNTDYIFSYFVKPDPNTIALDMGPRVTNHFSNHQLYFQSTLGRVAGRVYDRNSTAESTSAFAIPYPNNWWRVYARVSLSGASTYLFRTGVYLLFNDGGGGWTVTDSSIGRLWIWGWQLEQGAFPTSYIPTSGSAVTRTADTASITGSNFSSWFNTNQGTFVTEYKSTYPSNQRILNFGGGATSTIISNEGVIGSGLYFSSIGNISGSAADGVKVAATTSVSESAGSFDGNAAVSTGACSYYAGATSLNFVPPTAEVKQNWIKKLSYYPTRLTNAQLQSLTR